ncbi:MAG: tetratricopeptide repeat protein [Bacteroidota bacterium]
MKSVTTKQIAVIAGIVIVIVLLLFANTQLPKKEGKPEMSDHAGDHKHEGSISTLLEKAKSALKPDQKQKLEKLEEAVKASSDKKSAFESIINTSDSLRQPVIAAYYMEQAALASPVEKNWTEAGNRYYTATRFVAEADKPVLFQKAMECFEKTLELNPNNTEAKINLASCYVEGSPDPMKGITMLREVEKVDSNNVNLQLNFAFFSEKSGQWDKAIARFKKVLKIQPDFIEAYLHLADAYEQKGDTKNAIESLKKYSSLVDDVTIKTEVQNYINKLAEGNTPGNK